MTNRGDEEQLAINVIAKLTDLEKQMAKANGITSKRYGVDSLPNMFIIDREGRVAHVHRGYSEDSIQTFVREIAALLPPEVLNRPAGGR